MTGKRKAVLAAGIVVAGLAIAGGAFAHKIWTGWQQGHRHCFKGTANGFVAFAKDHFGRYPEHTNGFGDALLMLVKSNYLDVSYICGPNDDGSVFLAALTNGTNVPEELCSRVYVQGLSEGMPKSVCMMYDRKSFPGGDHGYGWGRPLREYIDNFGTMGTVTDDQWPEFLRQQIRQLIELGFTREQAGYYFPDGKE